LVFLAFLWKEAMASSDLRPSSSSQGCTFLRALSQYERHPQLRNPDYLAPKFLSPAHQKLMLAARPWWAKAVLRKVSPGAYFYQISRIQFGDEALLQALEDGVSQVLIMGAGNDTRAFRFEREILKANARIIELDTPESQAWKTAKVEEHWGGLPGHVSYVPIDFNKTTLEEALLQNGASYDPEAKTLFFWEGVCYYLDADSVDKVLAFVREASPAGSSLVFDYFQKAALEGRTKPYGAQKVLKRGPERGEPFIYGIEENEIERFLGKRGLQLIRHMAPKDAARAYLCDEKGRLLGRQHAYLNLVKAVTSPKT
jgi:methyltransferase (TIGR00027 family)